MGLADNIAAVRANAGTHAVNIFVEFFKAHPEHQNSFPKYKGKNIDSLKSEAHFQKQVTGVTAKLLEVLEIAGDAGKLNAVCRELEDMPQHKGLKIQQFKDLGPVVIAYVQSTLGGSCDSAAWNAAYNAFTSTLKLK